MNHQTDVKQGALTVLRLLAVVTAIVSVKGCVRPHEPSAKSNLGASKEETVDAEVALEALAAPEPVEARPGAGTASAHKARLRVPRDETERSAQGLRPEPKEKAAPGTRGVPARVPQAPPAASPVRRGDWHRLALVSKAMPTESERGQALRERQRSFAVELRKEQTLLQRALHLDALSCDGARPHRDMICEIARRLCETAADDLVSQRQCQQARSACEDAKTSFARSCEE